MALAWFRAYSEFATDPKVQSMSESDQRRLVMLFCLRCCDVLGTLQEQDIAFALRITLPDLLKSKLVFIEKGFIDDGWIILNWDKRQFVSDSSTDRTRRYRERMRTSQERHSDGLDTDTDTKAEEKQTQKEEDGIKGAFDILVPEWLPLESWNGWMELRLVKRDRNNRIVPWTKHCAKIALGKLERWREQRYDLVTILDAAASGNWQGLYLPKDDHGQEIKPERKFRAGDPNNPADWEAATNHEWVAQ